MRNAMYGVVLQVATLALGDEPPAVRGALGNEPPTVKGFCPCRARGVPCDCPPGRCDCAAATPQTIAPAGAVRVCGPSGCYVQPARR